MSYPGQQGFTFEVRHRAAPQGSKVMDQRKDGSKFMRESSGGVRPFRTAVRRAAKGSDGRPMARFDGPVSVSVAFEFRQPKSNTDPYPTARTVGDIDKLTRAVLDGLVDAEVLKDDSLVVTLSEVTKTWGHEDRAIICVTEVAQVGPETSSMGVVDFDIPRMRNPFDY